MIALIIILDYIRLSAIILVVALVKPPQFTWAAVISQYAAIVNKPPGYITTGNTGASSIPSPLLSTRAQGVGQLSGTYSCKSLANKPINSP